MPPKASTSADNEQRRSGRNSAAPEKLGFPKSTTASSSKAASSTPTTNTEGASSAHDPLPSIERSPTPPVKMADFTPEQTNTVNKMIKDAVDAAVAALAAAQNRAATPRRDSQDREDQQRQTRALTADLMPPTNYYLPVLDLSVLPAEPSKIRYPRIPFSDHKGEIEYDSWKMVMKLFIEEYSGNFRTDASQLKAYFKCTAGEAQALILRNMHPELAGTFESADDVLKALDQRFYDHNQVQTAKRKYYQLEQGLASYHDFRSKFTTYATTGKIARSRWFEDVCEKINPHLKRAIMTEKYKMASNYTLLDEFLAVTDREERNIRAEEAHRAKASASGTTTITDRGRGILKKTDWRVDAGPLAEKLPATSSSHRSPSPAIRFTSSTSSTRPTTPTSAPALGNCFGCGSPDHMVRDCPIASAVNKKIAELSLETDALSENC